jgi:hypothetical protein
MRFFRADLILRGQLIAAAGHPNIQCRKQVDTEHKGRHQATDNDYRERPL